MNFYNQTKIKLTHKINLYKITLKLYTTNKKNVNFFIYINIIYTTEL